MKLTLGSLLSLALLAYLPSLASAQTLGTPSMISATVEACNGSYLVSWTAVSGATTYDIWVDFPQTSGYVLQKATANTQTSLHAADSPLATLIEIQACNSSGCGPLSSPGVEISWYSGCP